VPSLASSSKSQKGNNADLIIYAQLRPAQIIWTWRFLFSPLTSPRANRWLRLAQSTGEIFFIDTVHSAALFISPAILPALNTATVLLVDATFKVVPRNPSELVQLMTISAVAFDKVRYDCCQ